MNLNSIFTNNLPSLDLHGEIADIAKVYINDFIRDNVKLKNEFVLIIHGIGTGILKKATFDALRNNKNVIEFKINYMNIGSTIVHLKV